MIKEAIGGFCMALAVMAVLEAAVQSAESGMVQSVALTADELAALQ